MSADLLELLVERDPRRHRRSPRGNVDWASVLDGCLEDRETVDLLAAIPSSERRRLLAEAGRAIFRRDLGNYAAELEHNVGWLRRSGVYPQIGERLEEHAACFFAWLADAIEFLDRPSAEAHLAATDLDVEGLEHVERWHGRRGIVLLSVYGSHAGYAAPLLDRLGHVALVRRAPREPGAGTPADAFPAELFDWRDRVEVVAADARGGLRLYSLLAGGGVVGLYNDYLFPEARARVAQLFGRPVPVSRTLLALVARTRAVVVPLVIARLPPFDGDRVEVRLFPALPATTGPGDGGRPSEDELANQMSLATECLIRRHPLQWRLWNTLRVRWQAAEELVAG